MFLLAFESFSNNFKALLYAMHQLVTSYSRNNIPRQAYLNYLSISTVDV